MKRSDPMKKTSMDLTQGNIVKLIIAFAVPILLGQIFQNLYNTVDSIIVGNFVGTTGLAAVTASSDISMMLVGFFTGLSTGAGVLFSRHFGAKKYDSLHDAIHTSIAFSILLGAVMAVAGIILTPFLLNVVACPNDVFGEAALYLRLYLVGILFTSVYNVGSGVLRAVGDSRSPFIYLLISSFTNILLDVLLVVVFRTGVAGAAIATVASQLVSVAMVFRRLIKTSDVYKLNPRDLKINGKILVEVMDLGLPAAIQSCMISLSNLFVARYVNEFGSSAMAGIGAAKKLDKFAGMPSNALGLATATFVSQNYGAGKVDRAYKGILYCLMISFVSVAVIATPLYYLAPQFVSIFIDNDAEAVRNGVLMMQCMLPLYYFQTLNQMFSNASRGFGRSRQVMFLSLIGMIGMRQLFLAITMNLYHDVKFVCYGFPLGWAFSALFVMIYFYFSIWKKYPPTFLKR